MKKLHVLILLIGVVFAACNNTDKRENTEDDETKNSALTDGEVFFASGVYDFGTVKEGEIIEHVFKFTNTGSEPVIISRVTTSCGCTTPKYTSTPVLPGKDGEVTVRFDTNGQVGTQQKIITVASNGKNNIETIQLRGEVN